MFSAKSSIRYAMVLLLVLMLCSVSLACTSKPASAPTPTPVSPPSPLSPSPSPPPPPQSPPVPPAPTPLTKVQFLGHACFLITSSSGLAIITDPYTAGGGFTYSPVNETADIVTVSHEHQDHNNVAFIKGQPEVVKGVGIKNVIKGVQVKGIASYHDESSGKQRGANTIFCFSVDGVKFCHLGDLGHRLSSEQVAEIGEVNILFIPVGGGPTIDAQTATAVCNDLKPKIIIPMHYSTPKISFNLASVDDFLKGKDNVKRLNTSIFEFKPTGLPSTTEIIVLETAK